MFFNFFTSRFEKPQTCPHCSDKSGICKCDIINKLEEGTIGKGHINDVLPPKEIQSKESNEIKNTERSATLEGTVDFGNYWKEQQKIIESMGNDSQNRDKEEGLRGQVEQEISNDLMYQKTKGSKTPRTTQILSKTTRDESQEDLLNKENISHTSQKSHSKPVFDVGCNKAHEEPKYDHSFSDQMSLKLANITKGKDYQKFISIMRKLMYEESRREENSELVIKKRDNHKHQESHSKKERSVSFAPHVLLEESTSDCSIESLSDNSSIRNPDNPDVHEVVSESTPVQIPSSNP